jgi:hypothetical protein
MKVATSVRVNTAMKALKYIVPYIALRDLPCMCAVALIGAVMAGVYGALHDQITIGISPEYFTHVKFTQFHFADVGLGDRVFVWTIGFLAGSSVGLVIAWFLARRLIPDQPRSYAYRQVAQGFACVFLCGLFSGLLGFAYGLWRGPDADYSSWAGVLARFGIQDTWSFVRVAYIHNASYLGGAVGLIAALATIRPCRHSSTDTGTTEEQR